MSGGAAIGLVVGGKLEGLTFNTRGADAQAQVMDALKQTFGEPTSVAPKQVQNSLGETFDTVDATWGLPQVEIFFRAVTARVDVGLLSVDTGLVEITGGSARPDRCRCRRRLRNPRRPCNPTCCGRKSSWPWPSSGTTRCSRA
jgi:hypothetical protein